MNKDLYNYRAKVTRIKDGDTIVCDIDLGFYTVIKDQVIRLVGINSPETHSPEGVRAKDFLQSAIDAKDIVIKTSKSSANKDKYGRWLGVIYLDDENINELMIRYGFASYY